MRAVIIAGGLGSRIKTLFNNLPKALLPIGDKPLLGHQIDFLLRNNINKIIILSGYKHEEIREYIKYKSKYQQTVEIINESQPVGSGGCLQYLPSYESSSFLLFGDIFLNMSLNPLISFHKMKKSLISIVLQTNDHPLESDLIKIAEEDQKCIDIHCKPHGHLSKLEGYMVAGVFLCESGFLKDIPTDRKLDLVQDLIAPKVRQSAPIFGYYTKEYLNDIGTPERYKKVYKEWTSKALSERNTLFYRKE